MENRNEVQDVVLKFPKYFVERLKKEAESIGVPFQQYVNTVFIRGLPMELKKEMARDQVANTKQVINDNTIEFIPKNRKERRS